MDEPVRHESTRVEKPITKRIFDKGLQALIDSKIYNHGLNVDRQFEFRGQIYKSQAIKVHDRRLFLSTNIEKGTNNFAIMDIVNLRQADMAIDTRGSKAADLLLNNLSQVVVEFQNRFNSMGGEKHIDFCRYGGDEFGFSYTGLNDREIEKINNEIGKLVGSVEGFYKPKLSSGEIVRKNVQVEFKLIDKPKDQFGKSIFDHFMNDGVLLKKEEVEKLIAKFENLQNFQNWQSQEVIAKFYPDSCKSLDSKLDYLSKINPLMTGEIARLTLYARYLGEPEKDHLKRELEAVFADPLLKGHFLSTVELIDNIKAGNISHVWTKELKYLKQFNSVSYADGDNAIKTVWKKIQETIDQEDREKLIYVRNGGSFLIGLKEGQVLSEETKKGLTELNSIFYEDILQQDSLTIGIGSFDHEVNREFITNKFGLREKLSVNEQLKVFELMAEENKLLFTKSDEEFYNRLAKRLFSPRHIEGGEIKEWNWNAVFPADHTNLNGLYTDSLNHDYFINKRAIQHLIGLEKAINNLDTAGGALFGQNLDAIFGAKRPGDEKTQTLKFRQKVLKQVLAAMTYSYANSILEDTELQELNEILSSV